MKSILITVSALLLLSGCASAPTYSEPVVERVVVEKVIVVHEYPASVWSFGLGWGGSYYRHGPWRR